MFKFNPITGKLDLVNAAGTGGLTQVTADSPLAGLGTSVSHLSIPKATALIDGYLDHTDFATFLAKQDSLGLTDPGANTIAGWDDTDNAWKWFTIGTNLSYDHATHTLSATGGGGMTNPMTTLGDIIFENATPVPDRLAGNTTNTKKYLQSAGSGGVATAPSWQQVAYADISGTPGNALLLDQTTPQTVINGAPIFSVGVIIGGTATKQSTGGPELLSLQGSASSKVLIWGGVATDTNARFLLSANGLLEWGAGVVADQDISLFRNEAGNITVQSFTVNSANAFRVNQFSAGTGVEVLGVNTTDLVVRGASFVSTVSGYVNRVPATFTIDSSYDTQPQALYVKNATNYAHLTPLVKFSLLNAGDSGAVLNLINAGTGNYITADSAFSVTKSGTILATGSLGSTGARLVKGWFADLEVTNAIAANITGTSTGITGLTDPGANTVAGWDDTDNAWKWFTIGTNLSYNHATHTLSATGGGTPGGTDTQVQFNDSSAFGGDSTFTWNKTTHTLTVNTLTIGRGTNNLTANTAFGYHALAGNNSSYGENTAIGYNALNANTTGYDNTGVGNNSLMANVAGYSNTAIGAGSLHYATAAIQNVAIGTDVMSSGSATTISNNVGVGYDALTALQTGTDNMAIGSSSLAACTSGVFNSGIGAQTLNTLSTGGYNTAIGSGALFSCDTGSRNVAIGFQAGRYELGSDAFYVDNRDRTNTAGDKAKALLYGIFDASAANQKLKINGELGIGTAGLYAIFSTSSIATSSKTFTFPNVSGTLALTSDIPVVTGFATKALDNLANVAMNASLQWDNTAARTFDIAATANTVVGRALTISAGSTVTGGTADMAGGNLTLNSGLGKGTGESSIIFNVGRTDTTGNTLQTLTEVMRISGDKVVSIGYNGSGSTLNVRGPNVTLSNTVKGILNVSSSDIQAIDKGGSITLSGNRDNAGAQQRVFASIEGKKETVSANVENGYLSFKTNNGSDLVEAIRINSSGFVGIGITPSYKLHVYDTTGTADVYGVYFNHVSTAASGYGNIGVYHRFYVNPASASSGEYYALTGAISTPNDSITQGDLYGLKFTAQHFGSGVMDLAVGAYAYPYNGGVGTISTAMAFYTTPWMASGTITNWYGLYIGDKTLGTGTITHGYGVYQTDATLKNYFKGNVGIGDNTAAHALEITGNEVSYVTAASLALLSTQGNAASRNWLIVNGDVGFGSLGFRVSSVEGGNPDTGTTVLYLDNAGVATMTSLAGSGSRAVNASATGVLSAASDERMKTNFKDFTIEFEPLALLKNDNIKAVFYNWKDPKMGTNRELGMTYQMFKDILPEIAGLEGTGDGQHGYLDYQKLTVILWEQNKALLSRIEALENK